MNASPSLSAENPLDHTLKTQLIEDVLDVVDLEGRLQGDEQRYGRNALESNVGSLLVRFDVAING